MSVEVICGEALEVLRKLPDHSAHALVTDPPAGISFRGKSWDGDKGGRDQWIAWLAEILREARRVLKPGAHALVWALPRTSHWTATALEDAGFEVRDVVMHVFGTGFPKSKNLDGEWSGWGTALKPAAEHWILARAPLAGTVSNNVLAHGTGALNIDGCRVGSGGQLAWEKPRDMRYHGGSDAGSVAATASAVGRWPANVCLSDDAVEELDRLSGERKPGVAVRGRGVAVGFGGGEGKPLPDLGYSDSGGASRFFYCPKPSRSERGAENDHPTVKSIELMRWLVRMVTPPGGMVLDPFAGSGTTGLACLAEGCFDALLIEQEAGSANVALTRAKKESPLFWDSKA